MCDTEFVTMTRSSYCAQCKRSCQIRRRKETGHDGCRYVPYEAERGYNYYTWCGVCGDEGLTSAEEYPL